MTQDVTATDFEEIPGAPWIRSLALRTPTLPPATHTNVYLLGQGRFAIVDPASPYPAEQAILLDRLAALKARGETPVEIVLTHHHIDHVSGARALADALSLPIAAHERTAQKLQGRLSIDRNIDDSDIIAYGGREFVALLTPGHAPGHLCFCDESLALIAGDMVASIGTIIIEPDDDGDMARYLDSLERLRGLELRALLPAHGAPVFDADGHLAHYIAHRLAREARVAAALSAAPQTVSELVPLAYPDVPPAIYPLAERSLLAHLHKLLADGRARLASDRWTRA